MIVGDTTLAEITPLLEKHFGDWKATAPARPRRRRFLPSPIASAPRVFLIDQPGAIQSNIVAGQLVPPATDAGLDRLRHRQRRASAATFTSRLNMNLREDKHWAYGARSGASNALGQRLWTASAPVQSDKTIEAIKECSAKSTNTPAARRRPTPRK